LVGQENAKTFIHYVRSVCPENADYLTYLIKLYNDIMSSRDIPFTFRRLFISPFDCTGQDMPFFVKQLPEAHPVKCMFTEGLQTPPETFVFYFNNYLSENEESYKDKFNSGYRFDTKGVPYLEIKDSATSVLNTV
jgi:hypothetical protein